MAANMFVQISDIPGDATEEKHDKWIVVKTVNWGAERAVDLTDLGSTQRGHANTNFNKVEVTSELGKASAKLMLSVANGTVRPEIIIHQCRSGDSTDLGLDPYLIWKLKNVMICKYSVTSSEDGIPEETWELAYRQMEVEYKETDPKTNALKTAGGFKWDLEKGKYA